MHANTAHHLFPFSALPSPELYFTHDGGRPLITRGSALTGQAVAVEAAGPGLLA